MEGKTQKHYEKKQNMYKHREKETDMNPAKPKSASDKNVFEIEKTLQPSTKEGNTVKHPVVKEEKSNIKNESNLLKSKEVKKVSSPPPMSNKVHSDIIESTQKPLTNTDHANLKESTSTVTDNENILEIQTDLKHQAPTNQSQEESNAIIDVPLAPLLTPLKQHHLQDKSKDKEKELLPDNKKFLIETQDLLNRKRNLRKVDRLSDYNPVTLTRLDLFEKEYEKYGTVPPEYLPLHIVKPIIINQNISADLVTLNLNGIDQLTDYMFPLLLGGGTSPSNMFVNLKKLNLVGCYHLTDQGLKWIAKLFPQVQMIEINACRKITERGLHAIFEGCRNLQNLAAMANSISTIPDAISLTRLFQGSFQWAGNPIISEGKTYSLQNGESIEAYQDILKRKLIILRHESLLESAISLLTRDKKKKVEPFTYMENFTPPLLDTNEPQYIFNICEISSNSPLLDSLITEGSIVMIAYNLPPECDDLSHFANQIAEIISAVVIRSSDVVILLVEIMNDVSKESNVNNLIKKRLVYLKDGLYRATYHLYQRNWHLECLDFKGQQGLSWGIASLEGLEELVQDEGTNRKMKAVKVTKSSFYQNIAKPLNECAKLVKTTVPWLHCEWSTALNETTTKIPKVGASTQADIFELTDLEARTKLHKRYSYPRLGKVLNLLQNWGEAIYVQHKNNSLCATDMKSYEQLISILLDGTSLDMVKIKCLKEKIPYWSSESLGFKIQERKLDIKLYHAVSLLKHQGLILKIKNHLAETKLDAHCFYIKMSDIPDEHPFLTDLWPEPCPKSKLLQTNRCYNLLPTIPPSFIAKLLNTILKIYQPLCIWKTGFLLRQGPVDVKASLHSYKGGELDKTPVLVVSARVVDLSKNVTNETEELNSNQYARQVMFTCLRQVLLLVDSVFQKLEVYGCITLPCPECAEHSTNGMISIDKNWHLPFYIALANKQKHCKQHPHINHDHLCEAFEDQGESRIVPLHNYPYHIDAVKVHEERVKAHRHRPMDPPEKCFFCGCSLEIPCLYCNMCSDCTKQFTKCAKIVQPGFITSKSFKVQLSKDGEMQDDEHILSNTKGSVYYYKKGHRMQLLPAMTPFYWDEIFITILRGANFFLHLTFGTGKRLEYHGLAGALVDQHGVTHQNEMWKSRDANLINIKIDSVEIGKKVRVSIFLKGLKVLSEEVDGWNMILDITSEKPGIYIIHTPGIKTGWQSDSKTFLIGSTLEVAEDSKTIHQALIVDKSSEGYLTLTINGKQQQYVYTSPQLMPMGTAHALQATLASSLSEEMKQEDSYKIKGHEPLWSFLKYQVPSGFEKLMQAADNSPLIFPCTEMDFPSVLYSKQVHMKDTVEKIMFTDGKWNFPMTALLLLPANFKADDLKMCSQQRLLDGFKLHPLCCFRSDVNTLISLGPTSSQLETLECFHIVHMVDNAGFKPNITDQKTNVSWFDVYLKDHKSSFCIFWAWMILLLRLQPDSMKQYTALTSRLQDTENMPSSEIFDGLKQMVQFISQSIFLSLGKDFNFSSSITDVAVEHLKTLTLTQGESQGLVQLRLPFVDDYLLMCESHQASWLVSKSLNIFSGVPGQYSQFIYSLNLSGNNLTQLPAKMFTSLKNLKDLSLASNKLESLPPEIAHCKQLMTLFVSENCLKNLPSSLKDCQEISRLDISKNMFLEFPEVILSLKNLVRLYASHLLLKYLPENIGDLSNLEIFSLNGNCLTLLPASFGNLQKLTELYLNGVSWIKSRNNGLLSKENFEDFLTTNNLHQWLDRHIQDKTNIFQLFDEDTNGTLDSKEIGKLNAIIFYIFPRFGYKGKEPPGEELPSGFPEIIFELKNLQYLTMQYQGVISVPDEIKKLTQLSTLHLGNNPNLLTVSAQVGSLPLKRLELEACPRLKTPPKEIRAKGFYTTFAYLKRLLTGSVSCKRTKLMLVGLGGAGKTSLVKALLSDSKKTLPTLEQEITDGIDICQWTVPTKDGAITYNVWDFAGQTVYYNTHQFFLSDRAVYLLLWNIRLGHEHAGLQFWLNSISVHAPKAPIFVVGTHLDQMSKIELPKDDLQKKYNQICGFHFVSSFTGQGIQELQDRMVEITLQQQYMGEKIPGVWLSFEESIKSITDRSVIEYKELEIKASRSGIFEVTEIAHAVQFLHELGSLQHFSSASLKSYVVISPQWLVNVMACVVSVKDSHIKDGKLHHSDIKTVWKDYDPSLHNWLLMLTEEFDLSFPIKDSPIHLLPCLLPEIQAEFEWPEIHKDDFKKETKILYKFDYLPAGLFNRAQVRLHQFSDSSLIWKKGSYLKKNVHICLIHQSKETEVTVKAYGPRPENIVWLVHEIFEILILESFQGITYDFLLPCPDCLKLATKDPHMFPASIIRRATELKSPFLQCLKYFHTISITDLHAIMPPDNSKDFDLHLVQAVRGMKELKHDLLPDIFVSYCEKDLKTNIEISPIKIIKDVEKLGYKCWLTKDKTESMDEMAKALMDAKIFLVLISNSYVKDETCSNLFRYAIQTLKKTILLVAMGENLDWQRSSLGILTADMVYVNMTQSKRYESKIQELHETLRKKHVVSIENVEKVKSYPSCFISYTWKNSAQAVAKGSRTTEGAIGFGDPREIKHFLENKGISCWLDEERVGKHGLFEDIAEGLLHCKLVVVCISDQYVESDNCNKEFRYAVNILQVPVILAVVGSGDKWRTTELGIMSLKFPLVSFQEKSESAENKLFNLVQLHLSEEKKEGGQLKKKETEKNELVLEHQRLSFQELCELAQRKFLRQITEYTEQLESGPYPRLILIDFNPEIKEQDECETKDKSDFHHHFTSADICDQKFCAHLLCEHEEGWHLSGDVLHLNDDFGHSIEQYLPYIARMTMIAKYSKKIVLNCLTTRTGQKYMKWLEENPSVNIDFQTSYVSLRQFIYNSDPEYQSSKLKRCLLPSGKNTWLCEAHRGTMKATVLTKESSVRINVFPIEIQAVDFMLQALQDVEPIGLSQHLQNKAETLIHRNQYSDVIQSDPQASPKKISTSVEQAAALEQHKEKTSKPGVHNKSTKQDAQRPTSRACLLM